MASTLGGSLYIPFSQFLLERTFLTVRCTLFLQKVAATYALRLAACPATWPTRATVRVSTTASSKETRGRPNDNAAIAARCGAITRRRACAIRAIPDAHSPHRQARQVSH